MRPVPQTRVALSPSTTATVSDPAPSKLAPTRETERKQRESKREERGGEKEGYFSSN